MTIWEDSSYRQRHRRSWNWSLCSMNHHHHIQLQALNASGRRERAPRRPVVRLRPLQGGGLQGACGVAIIRAWHLPEGHRARPWTPHDLPYTCASNLPHRAQAEKDTPQHMWRKQRSKSCCTNGDHLTSRVTSFCRLDARILVLIDHGIDRT